MKSYTEQAMQIRDKLEQIRQTGVGAGVFGSESHKYHLDPPATPAEVATFEQEWGIELPESYRTFLLHVGNGGFSFGNSAAGPYYGIYQLGHGVDEMVTVNTAEALQAGCTLKPGISKEEWESLTASLEDENVPDEEYDRLFTEIFAGVLPIGSQGCTYLHGLILNGPHAGRVINMDMQGLQPRFAKDDDFLDWYERWLDLILDGTLTTGGVIWYGYDGE